ncbi:MAG: hypothetical protein EPN91_05845 [Salinibacterium sp.]|nr:MAG: hypothetical protein EPN91_05845 [Salinibacterium sp.]
MIAPIPKTETELQAILASEIEKILGSNIHSVVFDRRNSNRHDAACTVRYAELEANIHLWERLTTAADALRALKGYNGKHRGFVKVDNGS